MKKSHGLGYTTKDITKTQGEEKKVLTIFGVEEPGESGSVPAK